MFACEHCGKSVVLLQYSEELDKNVCSDCIRIVLCPECDDEYDRNDLDYCNTLEKDVCPSCNIDFVCPRCGDHIPQNDEVWSETHQEYVCSDCNPDEMCEGCQKMFREGSLKWSETTNGHVCEDCFDDAYCESCNTYFNRDDACYSERNGATYCPECYSNEETHDGVHSYSYKPDCWNHYSLVNGEKQVHYSAQNTHINTYLGIEVEMKHKESNQYDLSRIRDRFDPSEEICFFKEDGSLHHSSDDPGEGVELVIHPMSLEFLMQNEALWNAIEKMRSSGARGDTPSCGIHIHITKIEMSHLHRAKMHLFFLVNQNMIERVARRKNSSYAKFIKRNVNGDSLRNLINSNCERYSCLNWQNSKTVEMRIFKSTLNTETIKAYAQFADAVYEFTKLNLFHNCTSNNSWSNFCLWLKKKEKYSILNEYLKKRNALNFVFKKEEMLIPFLRKQINY